MSLKKPNLPPGPWQDEPDHYEFEHAGKPCIVHRNNFGAWCGYAAVNPSSILFDKAYNEVRVDVNGGLTYADHCQGDICHEPKPGEPDDVYWFGFDCAHYYNYVPTMAPYDEMEKFTKFYKETYGEDWPTEEYAPKPRQHYVTFDEVVQETKSLAEQLTALEEKGVFDVAEIND